MAATNWAITAKATAAEAKEVGTDSNGQQNKARLYIGQILSNGGSPVTYSAFQAVQTSQILTTGLLNGIFAKQFTSHTAAP